MATSAKRLYRTERTLTRTLRVAYPAGRGRMVLRTELDWDRDLEPVAVSEDGNVSTFALEVDQPFLYFKPCLVEGGATHWAVGPNKLVIMTEKDARVVYPHFFDPEVGRFSPLIDLPSKLLDRDHKIRGYVPPGYDENTLSRYPVVFMQDGQNLFFPAEAFMGTDWKVDETGDVLRAMNAVEDILILGIYSGDRMTEYTKPGYVRYARSLVEEIVPELERRGVARSSTAASVRSGAPPSGASSRSTRCGSTPRSSAPPSACRAPSPTRTTSSTGCSRSRSGMSGSISTAAGPATTTRSPSGWPWPSSRAAGSTGATSCTCASPRPVTARRPGGRGRTSPCSS
jgi:hypothetical protein